MFDITPAAERTIGVLASLTDDQVGRPSPCPDLSVGDLVDHLGVFAVHFDAAARKGTEGRWEPPPPPSAGNLEPGWRDRLARDLRAMAEAWHDPEAWAGVTHVGGLEMPGEIAGLVALDELVVHGWDLAVATAQPYAPAPDEVDAAMGFVATFDVPRDGSLFGPVVPVADDAPAFERLLGQTGRDPGWAPPA